MSTCNEELLYVQDHVCLEIKLHSTNQNPSKGYFLLTTRHVYFIAKDSYSNSPVATSLDDIFPQDVAAVTKARTEISLPDIKLCTRRIQHIDFSVIHSLISQLNKPTGLFPTTRAFAWKCSVCWSLNSTHHRNGDKTLANFDRKCRNCGILAQSSKTKNISTQGEGMKITEPLSHYSNNILGTDDIDKGQILKCQAIMNHPQYTRKNLKIIKQNTDGKLSKGGHFGLQMYEGVDKNDASIHTQPSKAVQYTEKKMEIKWILHFPQDDDKKSYKRLARILKQQIWNKHFHVHEYIGAVPMLSELENRQGSQKTYQGSRKLNRKVGVAGLEEKSESYRQHNEKILDIAFTDLYMLILSAEQLLAFANNYQKAFNERAISHKDDSRLVDRPAISFNTKSLQEVTAEYSRFSNNQVWGRSTTSLVDFWFAINSEVYDPYFMSPAKFREAAERWDDARLSIALRKYRSGVLVVEPNNRAIDANGKILLDWFKDVQNMPLQENQFYWHQFNKGIAVVEAAEEFHWTLTFASEVLDLFEQKGDLCRDISEGEIKFWRNIFPEFI